MTTEPESARPRPLPRASRSAPMVLLGAAVANEDGGAPQGRGARMHAEPRSRTAVPSRPTTSAPAIALATALLLTPTSAHAEPHERASTGMMITGIVLTSLGVVALATGIGVIAVGGRDSSDACPGCVVILGIAQTTVAANFLGVGIPFWAVGASDPDDEFAAGERFVGAPTSFGGAPTRPPAARGLQIGLRF